MALIDLVLPAPRHDPITMLKHDHDRFQDLVERINRTSQRAAKTRTKLFLQLKALLHAHERIEETIFYRELKRHAQTQDIVLEGLQEHHVADLLVRELGRMPRSSPDWGPKLHVLGESLDHHITEEERKMFPTARRILPKDQVVALGKKMQSRKTVLLKKSR